MMEGNRLNLKEILVREVQHLSDRGLTNASKWCVDRDSERSERLCGLMSTCSDASASVSWRNSFRLAELAAVCVETHMSVVLEEPVKATLESAEAHQVSDTLIIPLFSAPPLACKSQ